MNQLTGGYEIGLKPLKRRFYISAALFLFVAVVCSSQARRHKLLATTLEELTRAQVGLAQVKAASANRQQTLAALQAQLGQGSLQSSPEMIIYRKTDELKAVLKPDDMTITTIEKKGGEASLQYTLTFNNHDYNTLLNAVSALHTAVFPLTPVSAIAVTQADAKGGGGISYKVTGKIITSEKTKP